MNWLDYTSEFLSKFFDKPVVEIITTIIVIFIGVLNIMKNTSIGKKALNDLKEKHNLANERLDIAKTNIEQYTKEFKEFSENKEKEIRELKQYYESKLLKLNERVLSLNDFVLNVLGKINNVEIKKLVEVYKNEEETVDTDSKEEKI